MDQAAFVPVFKFRTIDYPEQDRFHVWVRTCCDYRLDDDGGHGAFDAEASGAALGPLILSGRQWRSRAPAYRVNRTTRRIRLDGKDSIRFTLLLGGRLASYTGGLNWSSAPATCSSTTSRRSTTAGSRPAT